MSISEFKATCLKVVERIRSTGQQLLITKNGVPAAVIGPPPPNPKKQGLFGAMKGKIQFHGDIVSPVGEEDWEALK